MAAKSSFHTKEVKIKMAAPTKWRQAFQGTNGRACCKQQVLERGCFGDLSFSIQC